MAAPPVVPAVAPPAAAPAAAAAAPPPVVNQVLDLISVDDRTKRQARRCVQAGQGHILEYEGFCDGAGFPREDVSAKPQYTAYLLGLLRHFFPAHQLDAKVGALQPFLLRDDKQSMQTLKNLLDDLYQSITGLVPFVNLSPANKMKKFIIDSHQAVHYQGGGNKKKNHFCFGWANVHQLTVAAAFQILTTVGRTDGDFILLITEMGKPRIMAEEEKNCKPGFIKLQMGTAGGPFSGHCYPLDNEAAEKEGSVATLDWPNVLLVELSAVNNERRVTK